MEVIRLSTQCSLNFDYLRTTLIHQCKKTAFSGLFSGFFFQKEWLDGLIQRVRYLGCPWLAV